MKRAQLSLAEQLGALTAGGAGEKAPAAQTRDRPASAHVINHNIHPLSRDIGGDGLNG
jgi:hypothetical protein